MSGPREPGSDADEFEQLLAAYANRELSGAQRQRLDTLVTSPQRAAAVDELQALHDWLDDEASLRRVVAAPVEAREEQDATWQRIARSAALAGEELRVRLATAPDLPVVPAAGRRARWLLLPAAAAAVLIVWLLLARGGPPALIDGRPDDSRLGATSRILMVPEISSRSPSFSWHAVPGARGYDVSVFDTQDNVVLERPAASAAATTWDLTRAEFAALRGHRGRLLLRVIARDGAGLVVGSTGDLPVRVKGD